MRAGKTKLKVLVIVLLGLLAPTAFFPFAPWFVALFERTSHVRYWGPVALWGFCVISSVFPIPTVLSVLAAGFLLGAAAGSIVAVIGTTVGACVAFFIGRTVAHRWVAGRVDLGGRLAALDRAVGEQGFKIVLLSRLSPIAPFISLNYAFGLTQVSFRQYAWGTLLGGVPGTVLYAVFGAGLHSLKEIITYSEGKGRTTAADRLFAWGSLAVTAVVTVWLMHVAHKAMRNIMRREEEPTPHAAETRRTD